MTHYIFDCDDVLLDWLGGFTAFLTRKGYKVNPAGPQEWEMATWIGCSDIHARQLVIMFNASPAFGELKACDGTRETVWSLRDAGHTASVVTSCGETPELKEARRLNIHVAFDRDGEGAFNRLTILPLGASKADFLKQSTWHRDPASLRFIEDNFANAKAGAANGVKSYCLRRPHNWTDEANDHGSGVTWLSKITRLQSLELGK